MGRFLLVLVLGVAFFLSGAWYLGMLPSSVEDAPVNPGDPKEVQTVPLEKLGEDLYVAKPFPAIPPGTRLAIDPIVIPGTMQPINQEEVASQVNGRVLFIGEEIDDSIVLAAGSAAFIGEPYYCIPVYAGRQSFVKCYRRLYEGDIVHGDQMVAMIEPAKAIVEILGKIAKIHYAIAEHDASIAAEEEGAKRYIRTRDLYDRKAASPEELGGAWLTYVKLASEQVSKRAAIKIAEVDKDQSDNELRLHEIRPLQRHKRAIIKAIVRQQGYAVKPGDPVVVIQSLERLQAEANIEAQYLARFQRKEFVTATIEPTILEAPQHEFEGHAGDVTTVAVAKDRTIVSGSEDMSVCVWSPTSNAPLRKFEHDSPVKVIACTPVAAKKNLCIAACADGSFHIWDLDNKEAKPLGVMEKAHGPDAVITSLAFSPDGTIFASGASDGTIRLWSAEDGKERYEFVPQNGVAQRHEDAVTSLHFTPQCKLVSASRDRTLRVWQLKEKGAAPDGKFIFNREGNVPNLGVSADGKWMLFDRGRSLQMLSVETHLLKQILTVSPTSTPFDTLALFSPDSSLILTAGAPEGRLQLWRAPDAATRGFEVRQFATRERLPVACAAFSPDAGKKSATSFAVSASGSRIYLWAIPTPDEVNEHRIENVRMTLKTHQVDPSTGTSRIGFEVLNPTSERYPNGRFEAGRPVTIVIE